MSMAVALTLQGTAPSQSNEQCSVLIKYPTQNGEVGRFGTVQGTATIPVSTELRAFRKRHDAKTWSPVLGSIVCSAAPCSWVKSIDFGPELRTTDVAVVAVAKDQTISGVANLATLPLAKGGCKAEVTLKMKLQ
jgi:hypothetical protein